MLTELDVARRACSATPSAASYFGETDRALQAEGPARARGGPRRRSSASGETEDERESGDTERKLRHQVQEGLEKVPVDRLGEVVIAYEPIWAIGTGKVATPEQAQEAIAFVRALVATSTRSSAEQVRILYGGSVKPDNAAELLALPDVDGASSAARRSRPSRSRAGRDRRRRHLMATPVCLVILDGWGLAPAGPGNAVSLADTPVFDELWARYPHTTLTACGPAVGLPEGQMGNSEVGHLNLGAGAVVKQDLTRIDEAVADGSLAADETLQAALRHGPSACT